MMTKQIKISDEVYRFLTIQSVKKGETFDQILRRLLTKLGAKFSENTKVAKK